MAPVDLTSTDKGIPFRLLLLDLLGHLMLEIRNA